MNRQSGLTLIEITVVIAILTIIIAFGMTVDFSSFTSDTFLAEESKIVSALERARSRAMANMCVGAGCSDGKRHGFCYDESEDSYVIFQGDTCTTTGSELIPANTNIAENAGTSFPAEIVFEQLTGNASSAPLNIIISDGTKTDTIEINVEGTINW